MASTRDVRPDSRPARLGALLGLPTAADQKAPVELKRPMGVDTLFKTLRTILTPGTEGPDVAAVQEKLALLGLLERPVSSSYDAVTEAAVKRFQRSVAIEDNGRVGPFTQSKLDDAVAVYGIGSTGPGVAPLQKHLATLGYLKSEPSGLYDTATETAVRDFQKDHKIDQTGRVGPATRQFIAEAMAEVAAIDPALGMHRNLLARAIAAEARGEPYDAKVAIAATILNYSRINDAALVRLVRSTYLSSNFDHNRRFYTMPTHLIANWQECYDAAGEALAGRSRIGTRSHFTDDSIGPPPWVSRDSALKIGRMVFYRGRS